MKIIQRVIDWIKGKNEPNHPVYTRTGDRWDASELKKLVDLRSRLHTWEDISELMGRTPAACKNKYYRGFE